MKFTCKLHKNCQQINFYWQEKFIFFQLSTWRGAVQKPCSDAWKPIFLFSVSIIDTSNWKIFLSYLLSLLFSFFCKYNIAYLSVTCNMTFFWKTWHFFKKHDIFSKDMTFFQKRWHFYNCLFSKKGMHKVLRIPRTAWLFSSGSL